MKAIRTTWSDGSVSYAVTEATAAEEAAFFAATDPATWIEANATISDSPLTPTSPPVNTTRSQAQAQVAQLAATLPDHITQAKADSATLATLVAGQPLTAEQVAALQNHAAGWPTLLQGLQALVAAIAAT